MTPTPELRLLANGALVLFMLAFLTRDELKLRGLVTLACFLLISFNSLYPGGPLWTPIIHNAVIGSINVVLLGFVVRERSTIGMRRQMLDIYGNFATFNPGQFRKLMRIGEIRRFGSEERLCTAGEAPDSLYLVLGGEVRLSRDGSEFRAGAGSFIGEVSLLLDGPATATVTALPGSRCVAWPRSELDRLMARSPATANALSALLNRDLARKLSTSLPAARSPERQTFGAAGDGRREWGSRPPG